MKDREGKSLGLEPSGPFFQPDFGRQRFHGASPVRLVNYRYPTGPLQLTTSWIGAPVVRAKGILPEEAKPAAFEVERRLKQIGKRYLFEHSANRLVDDLLVALNRAARLEVA